MKKKFIFLAMMLLTFLGVNVLNAQETTITIGSEEYSYYSPPIDVYYPHAMSQQVYPADVIDVPQGSTITEIAFKKSMSNSSPTRNWAIYMTNYENSSLTSTNSVTVPSDDLVYDGTIQLNSAVNDWYAIQLTNNFVYSGGNILLTIVDKSGFSGGDAKWYQSAIGNSIIGGRSSEYTPTTNTYALGSMVLTYVNDIKITYMSAGPQELSLELSVEPQSVYVNESVTLTAKARGGSGGYSYSWTLDGVEVATTDKYAFTPTEIGDFEYFCKVVDSENNPIEESILISVKEKPAIVKLTIKMMDTASDGWDGCYLLASFDDGTPDKELRFTGSSETTHDLELYSGTKVQLKHINSNWVQEHSYCVYIDDTELECFAAGELYKDHVYEFTLVKPLPKPQNLIVVDNKTQLYPGETTEISWDIVEDAVSYNVYVNDDTFNTENPPYELVNLPYGTYTIAVAAVFADGSVSDKSNSVDVQMTSTYPLTVQVEDLNENLVVGAKVNILCYDEFGKAVRYEDKITDEQGQVVIPNMPLPQYSVITVTAPMYSEKTEYIYQNEVASNVPFTKYITLYLAGVTSVDTDKAYYDENEPITLMWDAVENATYKVYVNEEKTPRNTAPLTTTIYTLEDGLKYNENGNRVYVSAVYNIGESDKGYGTQVKVNGYGTVSGTVTDGTKPVAGAEVVAKGIDNITWMESEYSVITDNNGQYELSVLPNQQDDYYAYSISVSKYGYESYTSTTKYNVVGGETTTIETIVLTANADVEFAVTATEGEGNVTVTWEAPEGATQYNVFRKDTTEEVVKLATSSETNYTDESWATLENGNYTYGVSALSETTSIVTENFDGNNVPEGWYVPEGSNWYNLGNQMFSSYGAVNNIYYLVTPKIDTRVENATISFRYVSGIYNGKMDELKVYYSTSQDGPWVNEIEDVELSSEWVTKEISLAGIEEDEIYVAFANATIDANGVYLDEVTFPCVVSSESSINWAEALVKNDANVFTNTGEWTSASNWSNGVPAGGANVFIEGNVTIASNVNVNNMTINGGSVTINKGASLTVEGTLVNEAEANLVINDGAQIFQNNEDVPATFVMNINNWTDNKNAWQFIASPLSGASVFSHATGNYDLFKYNGNEDLEWYNHKLHALSFGSTFEQGVGYLASHETANTIVMTGTLNNKNTHTWNSYSFTYDYEGDKDVANFNLLGNPFTFNMKWSEVVSTDLVTGYAYLNENGGYETAVNGEIAVGDAFFVKAKSTDAKMSYGEELRGAKAEQSEYINLIASGKAGRDNVIINLAGKQEGFTKMQNFNESIATVYVAEDNTRYGIYNCNSDIEEVVVSFNAKDMGDYTIAAVAEGGFSSVVLVDLFTGIETDLLTSGYTFAAKSGDNAERFVVRFSYSQESAMNSNFVYQSGEDLIIMAEGALQIVDMLGRVVYYSEVATDVTRVNVSNFDNAAYIVRVVNGEGVKTQKVVIY